MSLDTGSIQISCQAKCIKTNGTLPDTKFGPMNRSLNVLFSARLSSIINKFYPAQISLGIGGTQDLNVNDATHTDPAGGSAQMTKIAGILVFPVGSSVKVTLGASNPLNNFFLRGTSPEFHVADGGVGGSVWPEAKAVTVSGSVNKLTFTNTGAGAVVVDVLVYGG